MLDELLAPLRLPQRALDTLDAVEEMAQDLSALREGVGSGLATLEETTASIHADMTELSTRLESLSRMEDTLDVGLTELSARVKRLGKQLDILPTPQLEPGDPFPEFTLESTTGAVELSERWHEGPLAVAFLRHMGCSFCREHLAQLDQVRDEIHAAGGDVVAIFQNRGRLARDFCDERGVGLDCLGDPRRDGYGAVALKKGSWKEYLGPQVMMRQWQAARSGYKPGLPKGDVSQRPGTFVVGTDGMIAFAHYNRDSSDNPPAEAVVAAVREAAGACTDCAPREGDRGEAGAGAAHRAGGPT